MAVSAAPSATIAAASSAPAAPRLARRMLPAQVLEILRERIVDRHYAPGERINIDAVARELQVSSTPIREALGRLVAEGLVQAEPFVGFSVAPLPAMSYLRQLYEYRLLLEPWAAAAAAKRRDPALLGELQALLAAMDESQLAKRYRRFRSFADADAAFHRAIVAGTGNLAATKSFADLHIHLHLSRLYLERDQRTAEIRAQHQAIYEAIRAARPAAAAAAMRKHLVESERKLLNPPPPPPALTSRKTARKRAAPARQRKTTPRAKEAQPP